ncbi:MAG: cyclic nucleotide-binding domain-containing protein [Deltaproteobacteria bacterium]|nr:cyclic nucleotide-binding domain-containing protein [Deltaproteobacteria bacterium]
MRPRFDSRPLVMRRKYTATMRQTMVLEWPVQLKHGLHLFCVIAASVISRNVANQQILEASGPKVLGKLYVTVAVIAGVTVAVVGWMGQNLDTRRVTRLVHGTVAALMALAFIAPPFRPEVAIVRYVVMEMCFAATLLAFGLTMGASLGPREARKIAARIGAGGVVGGLVAGAVLSAGALIVGSRTLYLVAAGFALAPVFFMPQPASGPSRRMTSARLMLQRERADVPSLAPYGSAVAITTMLMVAATTLIDYIYRFAAAQHFDADKMTAFFGFVTILAGIATVIFQLTLLDRFLDRLGLFGTAMIMPALLILCLGGFALLPAVATLAILKTVDSGANMSLQQATGSLLLAPLSPRARSVWQGRIDGLAKRGGQVLMGFFLTFFPWSPARVLPLTLILCGLWIVATAVTRSRYVVLLTDMLGAPPVAQPEIEALDGATLRLLETELGKSTPERAAVILDLLEKAEHHAPEHLLKRLVDADPEGKGAFRVVEHVASLGDTKALLELAKSPHPQLAAAALLALADLAPQICTTRCRQVLAAERVPEPVAATAAGLLVAVDKTAVKLCQRLVLSAERATRLAVCRALGRADAGAPSEVGELLVDLVRDDDSEIARLALAAIGRHPTQGSSEVALGALKRRDVRGASMRALAEMGPPVVAQLAAELDRHAKDPAVANALTWSLGRIGAAAGIPALARALAAPIVQVRLGAAVALSSLHRRQPSHPLPHPEIEACAMREIAFYGLMRLAARAPLPGTPSCTLLLRSFKQRAQSSLETLFRMLSLYYPEDAMQGAFQAFSSSDQRKRQIAFELLDAVLDKRLKEALAEALGGVRTKERTKSEVSRTLHQFVDGDDSFLASLSRAALDDLATLAGRPRRPRTGEAMNQSLVGQILELQALSLFAQTTAEDLAEVATLVTSRRAPRGTVLFREGEPGDSMFLVKSGEVTLSRAGKIVDHVGAGEACGIVSVLDQLPRELTATVSTDAALLVIRSDDLMQILADRPLLMHSVFRALTSSIRNQLDRVSLGKKSEEWSW